MIKMTFQKGGKVVLEPRGYADQICHEATRPYEEAMEGRKVVKVVEGGTCAPIQTPTHQQVGGDQ